MISKIKINFNIQSPRLFYSSTNNNNNKNSIFNIKKQQEQNELFRSLLNNSLFKAPLPPPPPLPPIEQEETVTSAGALADIPISNTTSSTVMPSILKDNFIINSKENYEEIKSLLSNNNLEEAIESFKEFSINQMNYEIFKQSSIEQMNYEMFNLIITWTINNMDTSKSIQFLVDNLNRSYMPMYLGSSNFTKFLMDIYTQDESSPMKVYDALLKSNLVDLKLNLKFILFYLEANKVNYSVDLISSSFKLMKSKSSSRCILKYNINNSNNNIYSIKELNGNSWEINNQLLFLNKPINSSNKESKEYLNIIELVNKLFYISVSNGHFRVYQMLSEFFLINNIITSTHLIPTLIYYLNHCLMNNKLELFTEIIESYKIENNDNLNNNDTIKPQVMGIIYFYCNYNHQLNNLKDIVYKSFINNNHVSIRFKEIFFNTAITCSLEVFSYGDALYFLDLKKSVIDNYNRHLQKKNNTSGGIQSSTYYYTPGIVDDFYYPFINYHRSKQETLALNFWISKNNELLKLQNNSHLMKSGNGYINNNNNNSSSNKFLLNFIKSKNILKSKYESDIIIKKTNELFNSQLKIYNQHQNYNNYYYKLKILNSNSDNEKFINYFKEFLLNINKLLEMENVSDLDRVFYYQLPHSNILLSSIQRFNEYYLNLSSSKSISENEKNIKLIEYFKFISNLARPLFNLINNNGIWFNYLDSGNGSGSFEKLKTVNELLPDSIYKDTDFCNFWILKLSSSIENIDLLWNLLEYMLENRLPIYKKPISNFSLLLLQNNKISDKQLQIINQILINNNHIGNNIFINLNNRDNNGNNNNNISNNNNNNNKFQNLFSKIYFNK